MLKEYQKKKLEKLLITIHNEEKAMVVLKNSGLTQKQAHNLTVNGIGRKEGLKELESNKIITIHSPWLNLSCINL
jgi:hypothetical protein